MAILLQIDNLTKSFGDRMLFSDVTLGINEGDKIGLIAKNGMGKTTLLRCIAGEEAPDSGAVTARSGLRVGMLEQVPHLPEHLTVLEACFEGNTRVTEAIEGYEKAIASGDSATVGKASAEMDAAQAWDYQDRLKQLLGQLDIHDLSEEVGHLSGGQRKRVALAKVILDNPDLIILDEPTNHLDIATIEWLEQWLSRSRTTLLMVTHDRYFLDRVCTKIIEIDFEQVFAYEGNYDNYLRRRQERIDGMASQLAKVKNTLRREQEWMNRQPQARAGKAKYRIDNFYELKKLSRVDLREKNVNLEVKSSYIGSKIFEARGISKSFGDKVILKDFNYTFARGEKVGIVGHNGVGKSTFIKMLQGLVSADSGSWNVGETVRFGYYAQDGIQFDEQKKVIDAIQELAEDIVVNDGRHFSPMQFLQHFLFTPADQQKFIYKLSGGERARLYLASVLMRSPNFLILDELTNDLDIVTLGILEDYLQNFGGCLIVVSHDRFFLDSVVDHLFVFEGDGDVRDFPGGYSDYRAWKESRQQAETSKTPSSQRQPQQPQQAAAVRQKKMTFKERKEFEALSEEIEALNREKAELEATFASGSPVGNIDQLSRRYKELQPLLDEKEMRWLELSEIGE